MIYADDEAQQNIFKWENCQRENIEILLHRFRTALPKTTITDEFNDSNVI